MSDDFERRLARDKYGRLFVQLFAASSNDFTSRLIQAVCAKPFIIYNDKYFFTKRINDFISTLQQLVRNRANSCLKSSII